MEKNSSYACGWNNGSYPEQKSSTLILLITWFTNWAWWDTESIIYSFYLFLIMNYIYENKVHFYSRKGLQIKFHLHNLFSHIDVLWEYEEWRAFCDNKCFDSNKSVTTANYNMYMQDGITRMINILKWKFRWC